MKTNILFYGAGQKSHSLLVKLLFDRVYRSSFTGELVVVMADTGNEHPETYKTVKEAMKLCAKNKINFIFLDSTGDMYDQKWHGGLLSYLKSNGIAKTKSCAKNLIHKPLSLFVKNWIEINDLKKEDVAILIGLDKSEQDRCNEELYGAGHKRYPLIESGYDRQACQTYLKSMGFNVPMPSSCMLCPYSSEHDVAYLKHFRAEMLVQWVELEDGSKSTVLKNKSLLRAAEHRKSYMGESDLMTHKHYNGHSVKTKY